MFVVLLLPHPGTETEYVLQSKNSKLEYMDTRSRAKINEVAEKSPQQQLKVT
jgi:hypothetical protein